MLISRQMVSIPICRLWSQPHRRCGRLHPIDTRSARCDGQSNPIAAVPAPALSPMPSRTRIVSDKIDLDGAEARHIDRVFHHARGCLIAQLSNLEGVTMQVDGVIITTLFGYC